MSQIIDKNHWSLTSASEIKAICQPLFQYLNTGYFGYLRTFDDGSEIRFSTEADYVQAHYEQQFYTLSCCDKMSRHYQSGYAHPNNQHPKILQFYQEKFHLPCGFLLTRKALASCEFFYFVQTGNAGENLAFYLSHLDLLERFTFYFKEQAQGLFATAQQDRIIIPNNHKIKEFATSQGFSC